MKTAVTGANGQLGRLIIQRLKEKTSTQGLVALVRTPEKANDLDVEVRAFDYDQPETLAASLNSVDVLLLISGSEIGKRKQQHENVINAAKKAGVKKIVYTSVLHADKSSLGLAPEHLATEQALKASGITYTILRNGWYTENYAASIPGSVQAGAFVGSAKDGKISAAARKDYADAAVVVLTTSGHDNKVYELAGDTNFTLTNLAAEVSKQTGKNIPYNNLPEAEYAEILKKIGLPEPMAHAYASMDVSASKNDLFDDSKQLSGLIGRSTTPLAEVVKETLAKI
ncbi:MAG: SDR family oxidoreductase [Cyclobacteriaceae bacterium]|nr:SDR family oxidoreductase [Cyclobacteriaceae bacterium]